MNIPPFGFPVPGLPGSPATGPGGFSLPPPPFGIPPPFARPPMPGMPGFPGFPPVSPFGQPGMPPMPGMPMPGGMPGFPMVSIREIDKMNAKLAVAGLTNKVTNVWVGKISPVVEDETACGSVANWARVEKDGQLKSFGFCKFANAEGALRSLRLLNGLRLADDCLQLKVDQKTQTELDDYEKRKKEFMVKEEEEKKQTGSLVPIPFSDADEQDEIAKDVIKKVTEGVLRALNDEGDGEGVVSREIRSFREKQARLARESKERELEMERRRKEREEEEIRKERRQKERDERDFRDREEDWIEHEKERIREKKRIDDEIRDMRVSRREILVIDDQDEKKNRRSIRADRKRRIREIENDKRETKREREEEEAKRRERERREQEEERKRQVLEEARLEAQRAALFEADRLKQQLSESRQKRKRDNASIGQFKEEVVSSSQQSANGFSVSLNMGTSSTTPKRSTNPAVVPSVQIFKSEPEEEPMLVPNKKRKLVKLEEGSQPVTSYSERAKIQAVIDSIPTEKDEIFAFEINWTKIDESDVVEGKMKPWVTKKIVDFLGEEEETLIEFICKKLVEHTPPDQITALLAYVLEEEATDFVIRLWRMLIYNMLMLE